MGRCKSKKDVDKEHFAKMSRQLMSSPAFRALSPTAKALYPKLRLEWRGPRMNNNGKLMLSARQAAEYLGVSKSTAAKAFQDLQAKGLLLVHTLGTPGLEGVASGHEYELTDLPLPDGTLKNLYRQWEPGCDFPVQKSRANNPKGRNGK